MKSPERWPSRLCFPFLLACLGISGPAAAGSLIVPGPAVDRVGERTVEFIPEQASKGTGRLTLRWSDALGRLVEETERVVELDGGPVRLSLDMGRAVTTLNRLQVSLSVECRARTCPSPSPPDSADALFAAVPADSGWWDYQIIMWHPHSERQYGALKEMGISAGMLFARDHTPSLYGDVEGAVLSQDLRWYNENIATDFFSAYHRYSPDKPVNALYLEAQDAHRRNADSQLPFYRVPSLSDEQWRKRIRDRLTAAVERQKAFHPLYYSLGDETGIADLSAYWDFDFSPESMGAFRRWLQSGYGGIAALNAQWGTAFGDWPDVVPLTAAQAIRGSRDNFSAWADFREWMDISFAEALSDVRDAVRAADPKALAGIEGGQAPGWGGYDYSLLAGAVDAFELYDLGNSVDLVRSLRPDAPILTTSFHRGPQEMLRIWRELLHGTRGLVLWDEKGEFVDGDGRPGPRGKEAAPIFRELRGGIAALLLAGQPATPAVAIHYSPASFRIDWMLDQRRKGGLGLEQATIASIPHDNFTQLRDSLCAALTDLRIPYGFVSSRQIERGGLASVGYRVLLLPRSIALSASEVAGIGAFVRAGGLVLPLGDAGLYDEHGRKSAHPAPETFLRGMPIDPGIGHYANQPAFKQAAIRRQLSVFLDKAGAVAPFGLSSGAGGEGAAVGVDQTLLSNGTVSLIGLANTASAAGSGGRSLTMDLPEAAHVYDLRAGRSLGVTKRIDVGLAAFEPSLFAVSTEPVPDFFVDLAGPARQGGSVRIKIARTGSSPDAVQVFHVELIDPEGTSARHYSGNLLSRNGTAEKTLPLALNELTGDWTVTVTDLMTGRRHDIVFPVEKLMP